MRNHRIFVTTFATFFALGVFGVAQTWAQSGVISFTDVCTDRAYVMRGEAESATNPRVLLPLVSGSSPQLSLDISTFGPVTVLLWGLHAVQVNEFGGQLVLDAPVNIRLAADPNLPANINDTFSASFSPTGDRVALVSDGVLVVADIVRDANLKVTGLTNPTVVANLLDIGSPSDSNIIGENTWTGWPDFSPDGTKIVVAIFGDLWLLTLLPDGHTLASSPPPTPLTRTFNATEWNAAFSPDGNAIAYTGGRNAGTSGGVNSHSMDIYSLNLATSAVTQLTPKKPLISPDSPAWSRLGQSLAFTATGQQPPRGSDCFNYDIYEIQADGAANPTLLTDTVGTGAETLFIQWGW